MIKNAFLSEDESQKIACGRTKNATLEGVSFKTCFSSHTARSDSPYSTFEDVDYSIQFISFVFNKKILFLPIRVAENFPNLLIYHATFCSIKTVQKVNFKDLSRLRWLFLDGNQLETIASDTFEDLTSLFRLEMSENVQWS